MPRSVHPPSPNAAPSNDALPSRSANGSRPIRAAIVLLVGLVAASGARAGEPVSVRHEAWRACLAEAFASRAALSSTALAADAALRECRASEGAYLTALSASPLVDEEDVARVHPALLLRARTWLLSGRPSRML